MGLQEYIGCEIASRGMDSFARRGHASNGGEPADNSSGAIALSGRARVGVIVNIHGHEKDRLATTNLVGLQASWTARVDWPKPRIPRNKVGLVLFDAAEHHRVSQRIDYQPIGDAL